LQTSSRRSLDGPQQHECRQIRRKPTQEGCYGEPGQAILTDAFPEEKRGIATAVYAVAAVLAPAIGPSLGGWITDNYDWRWVFLINVPVGAILVFLIGFLVRTPNEDASNSAARSAVDWAGFGLITLSLGCLQIVQVSGGRRPW
jgi:DHA2 family multidrug resistance protein